MSEEESSPAPLRLRPRQRPAAEPAPAQPAPDAPPPVSPPAASSPASPPEPPPAVTLPPAAPSAESEPAAERPRLRAKPRLTASEDSEPAAQSAAPASTPTPTAPASPPPAEPAEAAPVKLRLQAAQPAAPSSAPTPPPVPPSPPPVPPAAIDTPPPPPPPPPPAPVAPPAADGPAPADDDEPVSLRPPEHILPHIAAPLPLSEIEKQVRRPVSAASLRKKKSPLKAIVILLGVLLVVGAVFWFAGRSVYENFFASPSEETAATPGQLIDKAQNAVAERRALEQARVDAVGEGREPPAERALNTPPPNTFVPTVESPAETTAETTPVTTYAPEAPEPEPAAPAPVVIPPASAEFVAFIDRAVIGGVFQGQPPRALINGRTVRAGELIDERLGITFIGLDGTRLRLIFRDDTGAEVIRKF